MSQSELRREIRSTITLYPPNAFVGKIDRNSKTGILNKKPLYFIQCPCMPESRPHILIIRRRKPPLLKTIQVFINGSYSIFPQHILPFGSRKCILQHPFITVERHHLASLLFDIHLSEKVFTEMQLTRKWVLAIVGDEWPLQRRRVLGCAVRVRNPYVDALSIAQVRALREVRMNQDEMAEEKKAEYMSLILSTVTGVSAGLQNTG